jgi:hypothetical protein
MRLSIRGRWGAPDRTFGRPMHPIDALRRRLTKGLEVDAATEQVRRGEEVEALVTVTSARGLGGIEVGVVCTEIYDKEEWESDDTVSRTPTEAIAHDAWVPLEAMAGVQSMRLAIPSDAPFSYEGKCLSFRWEVVARGRRRGLDAQAKSEFSVQP